MDQGLRVVDKHTYWCIYPSKLHTLCIKEAGPTRCFAIHSQNDNTAIDHLWKVGNGFDYCRRYPERVTVFALQHNALAFEDWIQVECGLSAKVNFTLHAAMPVRTAVGHSCPGQAVWSQPQPSIILSGF